MPDRKKTTEYILRLARGVFITIAVLWCCGATASLFARFHLVFELSCQFYIQYFAFTSVAALIFAFGREWKKNSAMAVFAFYCGAALAPFMPYKAPVTAAACLKNSAEGFGLFPSWPSHMPPLRIPIDHCLYSAGVTILKVFKGRFIGSDHFPIIVDFMVE